MTCAASGVGKRSTEVHRRAAPDRQRRRAQTHRSAGIPVSRPTRSHPVAEAAQQGVRAQGVMGSKRTSPSWSTGCSTRWRQEGPFEVIADLAHSLPVAVICPLLGVPIADEPEFSRASGCSPGLDPFFSFSGEVPENFDGTCRPAGGCASTRGNSSRAGAATPRRSDSALIPAEERATSSPRKRSSRRAICCGRRARRPLTSSPTPSWRCSGTSSSGPRRRNPQRAPAVVEETLRYDPPVQLVGRIAGDDMKSARRRTQGQRMMLLSRPLSAIRVFASSDEFNPDGRHPPPGVRQGSHFCLGAPLARLEAGVALSRSPRGSRMPEWSPGRSTSPT